MVINYLEIVKSRNIYCLPLWTFHVTIFFSCEKRSFCIYVLHRVVFVKHRFVLKCVDDDKL